MKRMKRFFKLSLICIAIVFILALVFVITILFSNPSCKYCEKNVEWLIKTFEENDAGFQYILDMRGRAVYESHNQRILERARSATSLLECLHIMNEWTRFFRQGHIGVQRNSPVISQLDRWFGRWLHDISSQNPYLERLNETTLYLRIPSFAMHQQQAIEAVLAANREKILATENLIIDLRDNGGGSDASYQELLPFLYTNPIYAVNVEFLSTPHNNKMFLNFATNPEFQDFFEEEEREMFTDFYNRLQARLGEFVNLWEDEVSVIQFDTVYVFPKNIGIIINGGVASTAEQFLLAAKQSTKVRLFGTTTFGALDISNMHFIDSPCGRFRLHYGISRSLRLPDMVIDDIGLQPDVFICPTIPQYRWVEFVNDILNQ